MTSTDLSELLNTTALGLEAVQKNFPHELVTKLLPVLALLTPSDFAMFKAKFGIDLDPSIVQVLQGLDDTFKQVNDQPSKAMEIISTCQRLQTRPLILRIIAKCMG